MSGTCFQAQGDAGSSHTEDGASRGDHSIAQQCLRRAPPQPASRGHTYLAAFWGWSGPAAQPGCPGWPGRAGCRGRCPGPAPRGRASGLPAATRTAEARATGGRQFPLHPPAPPDTARSACSAQGHPLWKGPDGKGTAAQTRALPTEDRPAEGGEGQPGFLGTFCTAV